MPAIQEPANTYSAAATAAIVSERFVKLATTANEAPLCTQAGAGEAGIGIAQNDADSGETVTIAVGWSIARLEVDGSGTSIAAQDPLKANASGIGVKAASGENVIAFALEPSVASGDIIPVVVVGPNSAISTASRGFATVSTTSGTVTTAQLTNAMVYTVHCSNASATALAIPAAASVPAGTVLIVYRSGGATAVTITPASGTIAGGATHAALDAVGDVASFIADVTGTTWLLGPRNIA